MEQPITLQILSALLRSCRFDAFSKTFRLFSSFPRAKQYFDQFREIEEEEELRSSTQLKKHAVRVMQALNSLVENLDDPDKSASVITLVAKSHAVKHNVKPVYFRILAGVILEVLVETFPEAFGAEAQGAWSKVMNVVYWHVTQAYDELGWTNISSNDAE